MADKWSNNGDETRICKHTKVCKQCGDSYCTKAYAMRTCAKDAACKGVYDISKQLSRWRLCTSASVKPAGERGHGVLLLTRELYVRWHVRRMLKAHGMHAH